MLNTSIRGAQINDAVAGAGLSKDGSDNFTVNVDGASIEITTDTLNVKDLGITNAMLAGSIAYSKLVLTGEILNADLAGSIALTKLASGSDANIVVGDVSGVPTYVAMSGDITITNAGVTVIGATKVVDSMLNDDVATGLAGVGLVDSAGVLALDFNELTAAVVDVAADSIGIVDATDSSSKKESIADLVAAMAGTGLTATAGVLSADSITDNIVEADIILEDESANANGVTTDFTLGSTPVTNSLQVYLNGLLQQSGSGKDYTVSGVTVSFVTAPSTGDILLIHYIINN